MSQGKRAGARKGARAGVSLSPAILALAAGITLAVVAWGFLVFTAIRFGVSARDGDGGAWGWLAVATLGAMACLFVGMLLVTRLSRAVGITTPPKPTTPPTPTGPSGPTETTEADHAGPPAASTGQAPGPADDNPYLDHLLGGAHRSPPPPATRPPGGHRA